MSCPGTRLASAVTSLTATALHPALSFTQIVDRGIAVVAALLVVRCDSARIAILEKQHNFGAQVVSLSLSWNCFSAPPALFSGLVAGCFGGAMWTMPKAS